MSNRVRNTIRYFVVLCLVGSVGLLTSVLTAILSGNIANLSLAQAIFDNRTNADCQVRLSYADAFFGRAVRRSDRHSDTYRGLARVYVLGDRYEEAYALLTKAVQDFPEDRLVQYDLGYVSLQLDRIDKAVGAWTKVGADQQLFVAAKERAQQGRWDEAIRLFQGCISANPSNYAAYRELGNALFQGTGDSARAVAAVQRAIELQPSDADSYYLISAIYRQSGQYDEAMTWTNRMITSFPADGRGYAAKGEILDLRGYVGDALAAYEQALVLEPGNSGYHAETGIAYLRLGQLTQARTALERAVSLRKGIFWYHSHLGETYRRLGLLDLAASEFERAVLLNPSDSWARQSLLDLQRE